MKGVANNERIAASLVAHFGEKIQELLAAYNQLEKPHTPLTFGQVEDIWEAEVQPRLKDFASMQDGDEGPPEDSRWYANWRVPETIKNPK